MSTEEFKAKVANNIWHDLADIVEVIKFCTQPGFVWSWSRAGVIGRVKYVNFRFDMRDGGFIVTDDHGKRISLEDLKACGLRDDVLPPSEPGAKP